MAGQSDGVCIGVLDQALLGGAEEPGQWVAKRYSRDPLEEIRKSHVHSRASGGSQPGRAIFDRRGLVWPRTEASSIQEHHDWTALISRPPRRGG
jgi:hypothetical protein